ncbi:glycolate oxidase [Sarocladium strictum]
MKATESHVPAPQRLPSLNSMVNADDFEKAAQSQLTPAGWAYYSSGAEDELSMQDSRRVFRSITLRPRILRDVRTISTSVNILGCPSSLPIYISPTGSARYAHVKGEDLIVSAAGKEGLLYCMPSSPSNTWDAIFGARIDAMQPLFCQLYLNQDIGKAKAQVRRAVDLGARAIFITVDSPVIGKRERDERLTCAEVDDDDKYDDDDDGESSTKITAGVAATSSTGLLNAGLTWQDLKWVREKTSLPVVIKGIQSVEDAVMAYHHGADGIVLSNHGGRSQDTAQAPMTTLLEIRRYAPYILSPPPPSTTGKPRFQVLLDGGVRRGTDVIKALALGATAVGIGRPVLYAMTRFGEKGIRRLVWILRAELETNMALVGAASVAELVPEMVNSERAESEVTTRAKL